jgi:DNA-binding transcriptional ArsR family regulator
VNALAGFVITFGGVPMNRFDMTGLSESLGLQERLYLTREIGERAYLILKQHIQDLPNGAGVVLIFPKDQLVDASFADETIIRLGEELMNGQMGDRALLLQGLTADSIKNIEAVIGLRRLKVGFLAVEATGEWRCIGQLDPSLREVLDLLANLDQLTAPQLADLMKLAVNTASNRLKRLYDRRLVRREYDVSTKGLQYFYYFWQWT